MSIIPEVGSAVILGVVAGSFFVAKRFEDRRSRKEEKRYDDRYFEDEPSWPPESPPPPSWFDDWHSPEDAVYDIPEPLDYSQLPKQENEQPLETWWRNDRMSKISNVPTALMYNGAPVVEGDILPIGGKNSGRSVKVINPTPTAEGGVMVQENYLANPTEINCEIRPETVIMELDPKEARAMLKLYEQMQRSQQQAGSSGNGPSGSGGSGNQGPTTAQFAGPVFDSLKENLDK